MDCQQFRSGLTNGSESADGYVHYALGGKSSVVKAGPQPEVLDANELGDYKLGPWPAVADGKLIIRGATTLWCIGNP